MFISQEYEALFRNASIGILIVNSRGEIVLANDFLLNLFDYTRDDLLGLELEVLIPDAIKSAHKTKRELFFKHPYKRPMGLGMHLSAATKCGAVFPVEVSLSHFTSNGQNYVAAYVIDVTVQKKAEDSLKAINGSLEMKVEERTHALACTVDKLNVQLKNSAAIDLELKKTNGYLRSIWNHAGAIMIATNKFGIVELFNPAAEQFLGYSANEVIGKLSLLKFHDPEDIDSYAKKLMKDTDQPVRSRIDVLAIASMNNSKFEHEWTYIKKNGNKVPVDLTITALQNGEHCFEGFLEIAIDSSDRKNAEAELLSALQKEKELNELKSRFVSIASHEFRTPLSTILSSVYLISQYRTEEDQTKRNKHIERIVSSVGTLNEILTDLLSVGKIEEGKLQANNKVFDVVELTETILADLQGVLKPNQQFVHKHTGDKMVYTDPAILKHVITNLASNSIKFSPEDSLIQISTKVNRKSLTLIVKDNGMGIPKEDQLHLFELFFRASNASHIQGTGLGLHIVKRYVELLKGKTWIKSKEGKGTEISVLINQ